uniref:Uncharacterized protein n=1 Tax=Rhizophora mucronata TaxID=61149 RepID=A0A2P2PYW8_RHIMU
MKLLFKKLLDTAHPFDKYKTLFMLRFMYLYAGIHIYV